MKNEEQDNVGVLLACFPLGVLARPLHRSYAIGYLQESPHLNHHRGLIVQKIRNAVAPQARASLDPAWRLAIATQSLMLLMQKTLSPLGLERGMMTNPLNR